MGLFSLFNIVTFTNDACITTGAGNLGGTCFTSSECNAKGGSASGNCAAGFGVCCLFSVSGACNAAQTVSQICAKFGYCQLQVREAASTIPDTFQLSGTDETSETTCTTLSSIILTTPNVGTFCGGSLNPVAGNMIPAVVT
eukprot:TCALIF_13402-PA protein Name:"Protein of unknown function" AED:0.28 eAED:0.28 QI:28/0.5/0.71/1/0.66/0.71/7/0/140